eukprot:CAMPEP_0183299160 /NCGR_PEP_ID=MMETSP0160_2-20130417/5960_1 /TAXON_ID=2839 ORGANISM="Odontella Sinensis, Strain Grunow 1884" /NCGR_SAMPLE_ID=MMETSP0160_2 /ASSEMBLY_ACC=CAM_ASM_000250 /LENGTH=88 /DNA_ID=CAMNT_0025461349 /DNA_START=309 /DNA_END=575 /DNA_ORIENTATION=-
MVLLVLGANRVRANLHADSALAPITMVVTDRRAGPAIAPSSMNMSPPIGAEQIRTRTVRAHATVRVFRDVESPEDSRSLRGCNKTRRR